MSARCKLSSEFGVFTRLSPPRLTLIKLAASRLAEAHQTGDKNLWQSVIKDANAVFGKNERGVLSGIALSIIEGKNP